ncbi:hypothetical protein SCHPADRAFT_939679 [Schizopora paradoxa]|uniref:Uncharacterized protein n=1 Tax=Schizopora paradoxa TaxID=27342 RepID=A0A0H2RRN7_9AGAM|nr:hypothetical protein SCHPADRAFT_939679 [Schizopora paradoxa]
MSESHRKKTNLMPKKMLVNILHMNVVLLSFVARTTARTILTRDDSGQTEHKLTAPHVIIVLSVLGALLIITCCGAMYQLNQIRRFNDDTERNNHPEDPPMYQNAFDDIKLDPEQDYGPTRASQPMVSDEPEEQDGRPLPSYETVAVPRPAKPPSYRPIASPPPALVR